MFGCYYIDYTSAISHHSKKPDHTERPSLTNQPTNKQNKTPKKPSRTWTNIFVVDSRVHSTGRSQIKLFGKIKNKLTFFLSFKKFLLSRREHPRNKNKTTGNSFQ